MTRIPGDFVPLDVRYRRDRAIRSAGIAGELLYVRSLAHAKGNDTGGVIEDYDLPDLTSGMADGPGTVAALVRVGLWVAMSPTSWAIRSWDKWNPASDRSADGRLGNHQRWHRDRGIVAPDCEFCSPSTQPESVPDIAPESPPMSGGESQKRVEESREEKNSSSSEEEGKPKKKQRTKNTYSAEFEQWWSVYPYRKGSKFNASKEFTKAAQVVDLDALVRATLAYARLGKEPQYVLDGERWLKGRRWEDAPVIPINSYPDQPTIVDGPPAHLVKEGGLLD